MIIVLSPAKTLDYEFESNHDYSVPAFLSQSSKLINNLKTKEPKDIASLMGLSDKLAALNFDRYQSWSPAKKYLLIRSLQCLFLKETYIKDSKLRI